MYYDDENPSHLDILDRPDLFYGNPDDLISDGSISYPNGVHVDDADGYSAYGLNDPTESFDSVAVRGMVSRGSSCSQLMLQGASPKTSPCFKVQELFLYTFFTYKFWLLFSPICSLHLSF